MPIEPRCSMFLHCVLAVGASGKNVLRHAAIFTFMFNRVPGLQSVGRRMKFLRTLVAKGSDPPQTKRQVATNRIHLRLQSHLRRRCMENTTCTMQLQCHCREMPSCGSCSPATHAELCRGTRWVEGQLRVLAEAGGVVIPRGSVGGGHPHLCVVARRCARRSSRTEVQNKHTDRHTQAEEWTNNTYQCRWERKRRDTQVQAQTHEHTDRQAQTRT